MLRPEPTEGAEKSTEVMSPPEGITRSLYPKVSFQCPRSQLDAAASACRAWWDRWRGRTGQGGDAPENWQCRRWAARRHACAAQVAARVVVNAGRGRCASGSRLS